MDDSAVEAPSKESSKHPLPRLADVAAHAGVSAKTVSRVVNNEANVRPQIRSQVLRSVAALGYRPNAAARALVTQRTHQIGLIATASSLYGPTAGLFSLEQAAWKAGYGLTLTTVREASEAQLEEAIHYLMVRGVEGVIISGVAGVLHIEASTLADLPLVSTSPITTESTKHVLVDSDQVAGTRAAVRHLYSSGHRRIAHLAGPLSWDSAAQRRDGWLSQSNWTVCTLLSTLTPPAMVRHLPVLPLTSITSLRTGVACVTAAPLTQKSPRTNTPDASTPARLKVVMMSLPCEGQESEQFPTHCPASWLPRLRNAGCELDNMPPRITGS